MWFTVATEPDSPLGLDGTLEVLKAETGAESVRQLPTLKLFKIRMDLEMSGDTETLAKAAQIVEPVDIEPQPYDELDKAVIRATQGDLPIVSEPYAEAARELGMSVDALIAHLEGMVERGLLRRVAAILFHRRAGFSANGMGVWKVPADQVLEAGRRMAAFRGISHCYERPTYADWPYQLFTMAHRPLQGGVRRDPRRRPRRRSAASRTARRSTPRPSSRRSGSCTSPRTSSGGRRITRAWARNAPMSVSLTDAKSAELYARALQRLPGGVNSPVRAMRAIGRDPIFIDRAEGAELFDVDGNRYVDYVCSWGPLICGHAQSEIVEAVVTAAHRGTSYGAPTAGEVDLADEVARRFPSVEMLRMTSSGTEASMSAIRLARAATGRTTLLKFAGALPRPCRRPAGRGRQRPGDGWDPRQPRRAGVRDA